MRNLFPFCLIILFCSILSQSSIAQSAGDYRSAGTGNWNSLSSWERYNGTSWSAPTAAQGTPSSASGFITIRNGHIITITATVNPDQLTIEAGGRLNINSGVTVQVLNGLNTDLLVYGIVQIMGTLTFANNTASECLSGSEIQNSGTLTPGGGSASFRMKYGSMYLHTRNGGTIPAITWEDGSTCTVTGVTSTVPSGLNRSFSHFTWNCAGQTSVISAGGNLTNIRGNFSVISTGSGPMQFQLTKSRNRTLTVGGQFSISGGNLVIQANGGTGNINVAGHFNMTGGTLTRGNGNANINFNGTSTQQFTKSGGTISGAINFNINNGAIVDFGNQVLNGTTATCNVNSGATIITSSSEGLSSAGSTGSIQVGGARTYSNAANYEFRGANTGSFSTTSNQVKNLTFNRADGISCGRNFVVTGSLNLQNGIVTTGSNAITIGSAGTINNASSSRYINGKLSLTYSTAGTKIFPIGKNGIYRAVSLQYLTLTGTSVVSAEQFESALDGTLPANTSLFASRYWAISQTGGSAFTYKLTLDATGFTPNGSVVILKKDGTTITSHTTSSPDYTNSNAFSTLPSSFALGSDCAASTVANAGPDQTGTATCGLTSVTLSANTPTAGAGIWTVISGAGGAFNQEGDPNAQFSGISGTSYVLRWTVSNGNCTASDDVNITFNQLPSAGIVNQTGTTQLTCTNSSIQLTATGGVSYAWNAGLGSGAAQVITTPGSYSVMVTGSNGCSSEASVSVTEDKSLPIAGIVNQTGTEQLTCSTPSISLLATGGASYAWNQGLGSSAAVNINQPGQYTVTVIGSNGCSADASVQITQDITLPVANISNNSQTTELTCTQSSISVTATGGGSYQWNNGLGNDATASITLPGTYTVTVAGSNGCTATASISITQDIIAPVAGITNNSGSGELNCSRSSIEVSATGGGSYSWDQGMGTNSTIQIMFPGTYTVTVTGANGCSSQADVTITQNITPPANPGLISGPSDVCPFTNTNTVLTYSVSPVAGAVMYNWTVPAGMQIQSGQGTLNLQVKVTNQFPYNAPLVFMATAANGCTSSTTLDIIKDVPAIPAIINGPVNVCEYVQAGYATYSIDPVAKATSYTWTASGSGMSIVGGQGTTTIQIAFDSNFVRGSVKVIANSNCGNRAPRSLSITRRKPSAPSVISGPVDVCALVGTLTPVTYSLTGGANASSFEWLLPAGVDLISGQGTSSISVTFNNQFITSTIQVRSVNACGVSGYRKIKVSRPRPSTPSIFETVELAACPDRVIRYSLTGMPANANSIEWTVPAGASLLSGQGTLSITVRYPSTALTGQVTATGVNDCNRGAARTLTIRLAACPSTIGKGETEQPVVAVTTTTSQVVETGSDITKSGSTATDWSVQVFPNPTTDEFKIQLHGSSKEQIQIRIIHSDGRELKRFTMMPEALRSLGRDLSPGTYFIEVMQGAHRSVHKLVKL